MNTIKPVDVWWETYRTLLTNGHDVLAAADGADKAKERFKEASRCHSCPQEKVEGDDAGDDVE